LEDPNLKLGVVASDVVELRDGPGWKAIVKGETDPVHSRGAGQGNAAQQNPATEAGVGRQDHDHSPVHAAVSVAGVLDFVDRKIVRLLDAADPLRRAPLLSDGAYLDAGPRAAPDQRV